MSKHFNLPPSASVDMFLPKGKFYEKGSLNSKLQAEFINKLHRITWKYKLAASTINIEPTAKVEEIQIFLLELKELCFPEKILKAIDKAIPYPILYLLKYKDNFSYAIAYSNDQIKNRYYYTDWNERVEFDFTGATLEAVYNKITRAFIINDEPSFEVEQAITHDYEITVIESRIANLIRKISRERQFNRKVELNKLLHNEQDKLDKIRG